MVITPTPISLPVSSANLPTEAVVQQNNLQQRVPAPVQVEAQPGAKNGTGQRTTNAANSGNRLLRTNSPNQATSIIDSDANSDAGASNQADLAANNQEQRIVQELRARDREVRNHENAHAAVGGELTGAPRLSYVKGPDGVFYARSGEVSIDISEVPNDPEATIRKMEKVIRAALAPAQPSVQDQQVAARAAAIAADARTELTDQQQTELNQQLGDSINQPITASTNTNTPNEPVRDISSLIAQSGATDLDTSENLIGDNFSFTI